MIEFCPLGRILDKHVTTTEEQGQKQIKTLKSIDDKAKEIQHLKGVYHRFCPFCPYDLWSVFFAFFEKGRKIIYCFMGSEISFPYEDIWSDKPKYKFI